MAQTDQPKTIEQLQAEVDESFTVLAANLRVLQKHTSLTLRALAKQTHVSHTTLWRYLNGKALPSLQLVEVLARVCGGDPVKLQQLWAGAADAEQRLRLASAGRRSESSAREATPGLEPTQPDLGPTQPDTGAADPPPPRVSASPAPAPARLRRKAVLAGCALTLVVISPPAPPTDAYGSTGGAPTSDTRRSNLAAPSSGPKSGTPAADVPSRPTRCTNLANVPLKRHSGTSTTTPTVGLKTCLAGAAGGEGEASVMFQVIGSPVKTVKVDWLVSVKACVGDGSSLKGWIEELFDGDEVVSGKLSYPFPWKKPQYLAGGAVRSLTVTDQHGSVFTGEEKTASLPCG